MRSQSQLPWESTTPSTHDSPHKSTMSGVGPSVPVHMSTGDENERTGKRPGARYRQHPDPPLVPCPIRGSWENKNSCARPCEAVNKGNRFVAQSPTRLQSHDNEVTPALRLFVLTRATQHGAIGGRCVGASNSVLHWQTTRHHFDGPLVSGLDNEVHVTQLHVASHRCSCFPAEPVSSLSQIPCIATSLTVGHAPLARLPHPLIVPEDLLRCIPLHYARTISLIFGRSNDQSPVVHPFVSKLFPMWRKR